MKNIWEIFRRDIKRIKNNVIAMIVIMGITVVPLPLCVVQYSSKLGSVWQYR